MKIKLLSENAKIPTKSNIDDAGFDLYCPIDFEIESGKIVTLKLDIAITDFPKNTYGRIAPRSGLASRGLQILGGVVDASYQGNIGVILYFCDNGTMSFKKGDRIAQLIIEKFKPGVVFELVDSFDKKTDRGSCGFGSTGN